MNRYHKNKHIHGKGGQRETVRAIGSACCYTPEKDEKILPSRHVSKVTPRLVVAEEVFAVEEMGEFPSDLDVSSGPSELDLREIDGP